MTPRIGAGCNDAVVTRAGTQREAETRGRELLGDAGNLLGQGFRPVILYPRGFTLPRSKGPASGKEPYGKGWGLGDVTLATLAAALESFTADRWIPGLGICLGPGRAPGARWLIDAEGDGPEAESSWAKLMGGETIATRGWTSTRGTHRLLACDGDRVLAILGGLKQFQANGVNVSGVYHVPVLSGLELRIGGFKSKGVIKQLQSAVPPTPGTNGRPRTWNGIEQVAEAPESFYATLEAIARDPELDRVEAYLMGALRNAVERIEATAEPHRRNAYRDEALTLAGYLHYKLGYGAP